MLLTIDIAGRAPIYQQVADGIRGLIARGELKEGAFEGVSGPIRPDWKAG